MEQNKKVTEKYASFMGTWMGGWLVGAIIGKLFIYGLVAYGWWQLVKFFINSTKGW